MSSYYSVSTLSVLSNAPIPGLTPIDPPQKSPDLMVFLGSGPTANDGLSSGSTPSLSYVSVSTDSKGEPMLKMWELDGGAYLHIAYRDGTQFWFDRAGTRLWATWAEDSSVENTALYLLGPILALLLRYCGFVCLHASAIVVNGRAVAFVGPEESGKSTTAAAFGRRGFAILSDDVVPLQDNRDGTFFALPGSPHLRLWPESVGLLFGSRDALPPLAPNWDKRRLSQGDRQSKFYHHACDLQAIYILKDRRADPVLPCLETVNQQAALMSLIVNSYASPLIDAKMRAEELQLFARLIQRVPIRQLSPHADGDRIDQLCDLVCQDLLASSISPK